MDNNNFKHSSAPAWRQPAEAVKIKSNDRKQLVQLIADNYWTSSDLITIILELKTENTKLKESPEVI